MVTKEDFRNEYARFTQQNGELYEKTELPMTEEDRKKAKQFYWVIVFFIVLFSIIGGVTFYFNAAEGLSFGLFLFVIIAVVIIGGFYYSIAKTLQRDKKAVIKTIVTGKRDRKGYEIEIGGRRHINVSQDDYNTFNLGDIIQVIQVGAPIPLAQAIKRVGSIFDVDAAHRTEM